MTQTSSQHQNRTFKYQHRTSKYQRRTSKYQHRTSKYQHCISKYQHRTPKYQHCTSKYQHHTSKQSNASRHIHTHTNIHINPLTNGNIKKHLITLAFPLLIGNILQQIYNMTDSIVISHFCGTSAFAAAGISGTVMNLFLFVIGGCCTGISIILASFFGNKDMKNFRKECFISLTFGLIFTITLSITSILALPFILHLIQTPPVIFPYVYSYLNVILGGLSASFLYNLCASVLRAIGNTKYALLFLLISIGTNVLLDLILVAGFRLGIAGAAWATVISQLLSAFLCLCYIKKSLPFLLFQKEDLYPDPDLLRQTICFAAASALHQSSLYIGKLFIQGAVNTLGTESISAYTAAGRIEGLANAFGDSGAESISLFTAQNTGAGNKKRTRSGFYTGLMLLVLLGITMSLLMYTTSGPGISLLAATTQPGLLNAGTSYIQAISCFYVLSFIGNSFVGFYRGSGHVSIPFIGTIIHITLRTLLSFLLIPRLGLPAVAISTGIGWIAVVAFQTIIYMKYYR